jgi:hypothetical protein
VHTLRAIEACVSNRSIRHFHVPAFNLILIMLKPGYFVLSLMPFYGTLNCRNSSEWDEREDTSRINLKTVEI